MTDTLSIDFYGTLDRDPELWQSFMSLMRLREVNIYVISGPPMESIGRGLEYLGFVNEVHYDGMYSIISDLMSAGNNCWLDEDHDSWYSEEGLWWQRKSIICDRLGVTAHIDSDARFGKFFAYIPTRFIHVNKAFLIQIRRMISEMKSEDGSFDDDDEYRFMYGVGGI